MGNLQGENILTVQHTIHFSNLRLLFVEIQKNYYFGDIYFKIE